MPFRKKMKRALGGSSPSEYDPANPLTHGINKRVKKNASQNTYKPGETMPKPKYRGPWNQAHQDKLSAFSFGDAWRRNSSDRTDRSIKGESLYSPMGSRLPSHAPSRRGSAWSTFSFKSGRRAWGMGSREPSKQSVPQQSVQEEEMEGTDIANVGLSRLPTHEGELPRLHLKDEPSYTQTPTQGQATVNECTEEGPKPPLLEPSASLTDGQLFTADELAHAMSKSSLEPRAVVNNPVSA